jgi:homeobox-leucine zipper protein
MFHRVIKQLVLLIPSYILLLCKVHKLSCSKLTELYRTKLKHTEMECEYLKRCFGSLTEENRRLQREVEELRAMRMAPPTVLSPHTRQPLPASALTMCPRCERITAATGPRVIRPAASPFHPRRPSPAF